MRAFLLVLCTVWANGTYAAIIAPYWSSLMGCDVRITGVLEPGDAARIEAFLRAREPVDAIEVFSSRVSPFGRRVCLDSPGGSLSEALDLAEVLFELSRSTAVEDGAVCESACAVLFMAGLWRHPEVEGPGVPNRVLHPRGRLGFHAPDLIPPDGQYTQTDVQRGYALALETLARIAELRRQVPDYFPESLHLAMLRTPPEHMFRIETVGQAAQINIGVLGAAPLSSNVPLAILNLCLHAAATVSDTDVEWMRRNAQIHGVPLTTFGEFHGQTPSGFFAEASVPCAVTPSDPRSMEMFNTGTVARVEFNDGRSVFGRPVYPFETHPWETRLDALPLAQ